MSSPMGVSDETCSQDSVHASSQYAAGTALADTASFACHIGRLQGSSSTISGRAPNVVYSQGMAAVRARTLRITRLRRSPSPLGVSVVQCRARLVEQSAGDGNLWHGLRRGRNVSLAADGGSHDG